MSNYKRQIAMECIDAMASDADRRQRLKYCLMALSKVSRLTVGNSNRDDVEQLRFLKSLNVRLLICPVFYGISGSRLF